MTRKEKIAIGIPLAQSFAARNSRGSPEIEGELLSLLYEVLMRKASMQLDDPERYFKVTFSGRCRGYFESINDGWKKERDIREASLNGIVHNGGIEKVLLEDIFSSDVFTEREKAFLKMKLEGTPDADLKEHFEITDNRLKAIGFNLQRKLREFLV